MGVLTHLKSNWLCRRPLNIQVGDVSGKDVSEENTKESLQILYIARTYDIPFRSNNFRLDEGELNKLHRINWRSI